MRQRWLQRKWFALLRFRAALAGEASLDEAAQRAKSAASFKGGMRTLGARLMDHSTCTGLFGPTRRRARSRKAEGPSEVTARRISSARRADGNMAFPSVFSPRQQMHRQQRAFSIHLRRTHFGNFIAVPRHYASSLGHAIWRCLPGNEDRK
jgi:hypothetical protein